MSKASTARTVLDKHIEDLVTALLTDDQAAAHAAFADAQAHLKQLTTTRADALAWVHDEQQLLANHPDIELTDAGLTRLRLRSRSNTT